MSYTIGNAKDLDSCREQVLHGLLSSLGHARDSSSSDTKLSAEQLSEKINEILGDDADCNATREGPPSQLLNEDGLPIIDISEPVDDVSQMSTPLPYIPEQELTSFTLLPPDERERRRRDRDRILDLLEEEERLQQLQEERNAEEEQKEAIRKREESAKAELAQLRAARELQKKMGQALIGRAKKAVENGRDEDAHLKPRVKFPVPKKSVAFADVPTTEIDERDRHPSVLRPDWGDITPGRLRAQNRIPLVSTAEAQKYPMKMHVVERRPTTTSASPTQSYADSDDEEPPAGNLSPLSEDDSSNEEEQPSSSDSDFGDDEPLEEGFDYDAVQHHREIALEYHMRRHGIGIETAKALGAHDLDDDGQHEALRSNGQSPLSRFRADRMAAAYDKSHDPNFASIGQSTISASRQKFIRNSVRLGKLENDRLVGGDPGESGSEDETVREVIQMLRTGSIENTGPDFLPSSITTISPQKSDAVESATVGTSTVTPGLKPSKFKSALREGIAERTTFQNDNSRDNFRPQPVILGVVERKASRSSPSQRFPINKPPPRPSVEASEPVPPMIIDSPSFPMTTSVVSPPCSPARTMTSGPPSLSQTQLGYSLVGSSIMRDSMVRSPLASRGPSAIGKPVSKFMAERQT